MGERARRLRESVHGRRQRRSKHRTSYGDRAGEEFYNFLKDNNATV